MSIHSFAFAGALILDDCDTDTYGLEQAVDFIKGKEGMKKRMALCFLTLLRGLHHLESYDF